MSMIEVHHYDYILYILYIHYNYIQLSIPKYTSYIEIISGNIVSEKKTKKVPYKSSV